MPAPPSRRCVSNMLYACDSKPARSRMTLVLVTGCGVSGKDHLAPELFNIFAL